MSLEADEVYSEEPGLFEPRRIAFIESIANLRPRMHRYCARMTGSALDGEDVMQEAIFEAYLKLGSFDASRPLGPWLFRIAHNRCIDFLRRRQARRQAEAEAEALTWVCPPEAVGKGVDRAIERLEIALPPKERACVLLKDVRLFPRGDCRSRRINDRRRQGRLEPRPWQTGDADRRSAA
jgi:RNA polymerase sigma-70 factor (ECF subfamily)